jgi:hypothetical protein
VNLVSLNCLIIGLETWRAEQPPTSKWLNHQKMKMVGAIGFEPSSTAAEPYHLTSITVTKQSGTSF